MTAHIRVPRAVLTMPRAQSPQQVIAELQAAFETFKGNYDSQFNGVQSAIDDMYAKLAAMGINGISGAAAPDDPTYTAAFAQWARNGQGEADLRDLNASGKRASIQASMSSGTDSAGGYLAPVEWDRRMLGALRNVSPMRRLATVVSTSVRAYTTLWNSRGWGSGWVGETAARPETGTATLASVPFAHGEIYANPAITQNLLDDADFNVEQWLATELADEFTVQESVAFIAGNGTNKPHGMLTYVTGAANAALHPAGAILLKTVAASAAVTSDELIEFVYELPAVYRQNAAWLMNSLTASKIMKLKDGDSNYVWQRNLAAGQPATLLGYPVEIDENMPDMAADAVPIAFGDFKRGYLINDRTGVRILRDPYTNKPFVHFYATKRVGGGVQDPLAIRCVKMAAG